MRASFRIDGGQAKGNSDHADAMEKSIDGELQSLLLLESAEIVGVTQGAYINGYGAVFMSEVNLAPAPGISPFHPHFEARGNQAWHLR